MAQRLVVPPRDGDGPYVYMKVIYIYIFVTCVYVCSVCVYVCANVYSMYMYVYTHMSTYPSPPVDVVRVGGRWGCGGAER